MLKLVKEESRIIINTIPLAPSRAEDENIIFRMPVTKAVIAIMAKSGKEPYVSSRIGPIKRIKEKLETGCDQFACPITCVTSVIQHLKFQGANALLPGTINQYSVSERNTVCERIRTSAHKNANVKTDGELYLIFIIIPNRIKLILPDSDRSLLHHPGCSTPLLPE